MSRARRPRARWRQLSCCRQQRSNFITAETRAVCVVKAITCCFWSKVDHFVHRRDENQMIKYFQRCRFVSRWWLSNSAPFNVGNRLSFNISLSRQLLFFIAYKWIEQKTQIGLTFPLNYLRWWWPSFELSPLADAHVTRIWFLQINIKHLFTIPFSDSERRSLKSTIISGPGRLTYKKDKQVLCSWTSRFWP